MRISLNADKSNALHLPLSTGIAQLHKPHRIAVEPVNDCRLIISLLQTGLGTWPSTRPCWKPRRPREFARCAFILGRATLSLGYFQHVADRAAHPGEPELPARPSPERRRGDSARSGMDLQLRRAGRLAAGGRCPRTVSLRASSAYCRSVQPWHRRPVMRRPRRSPVGRRTIPLLSAPCAPATCCWATRKSPGVPSAVVAERCSSTVA